MSEHETALVVAQEPQIIAWKTPETLRLIKSVYAKDCSDQEFGLFVEVAASLGLSPLKRQIYAIKRGDKLTIQVGIDGFRAIAERSGLYAGQIGPQWCGKDGEWKDVWTDDLKDLIAARVGVLRRDFKQPIWGVARVAAYRQQSNPLWNTMPDVLAARSAEALALRKTFPDLLSGVYTHDEMGQADNDTPYVDATPTTHNAPVTRQEAQQQGAKAQRGPIATASTVSVEGMATERQITSIRKLCAALGRREPDTATMTFNAARDLLTQLSAAYCEARQAS